VTVRRVVLGVLATAAIVLVLGRWTTGLYTDYLWFASLGATSLWRARIGTMVILWVASFTVASLFAFANFWAVRRSVVSLVLPRRIANVEIGAEVPGRYLLFATFLLSFIVGAALALPTSAWSRALLPQIGQPFAETDPYFGADLGFFVYWLPLEMMLHEWSVILLAVVVALAVMLYALTPSLRWEGSHLYVSAYVRRHFMILGGVLMLVLAWSYRLDMYRLVAMGEGTGGVFTAVDHRVLIPATLLLAVVTFCAAIVVCWAGWSGQMRLAFFAVSTVLLLSVIARSVAPLLARRSVDPAVAASQERPYVATRHGYTRRAYGVDRMRPDTLGAGFASAAEAANRVAIWDGETLAAAAERLRRVRIVGDGASWQSTPSALNALLVERSSDVGADGRDAWGIGRFDATAADERGMPLRVGGTTRGVDETLFDEPAVFDSAPSYSVMSDSLGRLAGVEMVSTRSRIAHAWALQNFRLLFGELPLDRPMIVRHRDVRDRLRVLVPFFVQGSEVLPVLADDSLYWAVELYSASASYPLSERFVLLGEERGYLQHAATALIHAETGHVRLVLDASPDPVTSSWATRFPRLFTVAAALPASLRAALPPILDGARAQALAFAGAGFRGDSLEVRHFATLDGADASAPREPLHFAPPAGGVDVGWPLLDDRDRVRGIVAAEGGAQRTTAWMPLISGDVRWSRVVDQLRGADTAGHDNGVVRSPARVIPVGGRPVYFQSVVQWLPGGSPRLVHVTALAGDSVTVAPTLAAILGGSIGATAQTVTQGFRVRADSLYRIMRSALERGDWTAFGRAFDALGAALGQHAP
jgi:uncharacterized membrane protein (UPF0182 family)